jgi:hypothetical protein
MEKYGFFSSTQIASKSVEVIRVDDFFLKMPLLVDSIITTTKIEATICRGYKGNLKKYGECFHQNHNSL